MSGERLRRARTSGPDGAGYDEAWRDEADGTRRDSARRFYDSMLILSLDTIMHM